LSQGNRTKHNAMAINAILQLSIRHYKHNPHYKSNSFKLMTVLARLTSMLTQNINQG